MPADRLAKSILLDTDDGPLLAVLPSDRKVELSELRSELGHKPRLVGERELNSVFNDCDVGAVPPVGYGVTTIIDDSLGKQPDIYFEAGDHKSLVHMMAVELMRIVFSAWPTGPTGSRIPRLQAETMVASSASRPARPA